MAQERTIAARARWVSTALAIAAACAVLLPLLGHRALTEWDEGIYAEVSREMLGLSPATTHSLLIPHWNGGVWFEKPPLMLWITAAFFKLFGVTEFWARAGSAFSGIALVGLLHAWLLRRAEEAIAELTAWCCTIMLLATLGFQHVARAGEMDVLLSLGCILALIGLAEVQCDEARGWYGFWGGFAIALMTKGAASIVVLLTLILFAGLERAAFARAWRHCIAGLAMFLALVLPWHLYLWHAYGDLFVQEYLGSHVLTRAMSVIEDHPTHWWFYLGVLLASAAPFVLAWPSAIAAAWRERELRVFALFALMELIFFTTVRTRLPHYIAPVYPAMAVVTAAWLAPRVRALWTNRTISSRAGVIAAALALYAISTWITAAPRKHLHAPVLADGTIVPDNRETAALLRQTVSQTAGIPGPLLLWRQGHYAPISSSIFYSQRQVQQVQLQPPDPIVQPNKYTYSPVTLKDAVGDETRVILLERTLKPQIPKEFTYIGLAHSNTMEVGQIVRK